MVGRDAARTDSSRRGRFQLIAACGFLALARALPSQTSEGTPEIVNVSLSAEEARPYYFQYEDGTSFFAVGENIATLDRERTFAADRLYGRLAAVGGNFVRSW